VLILIKVRTSTWVFLVSVICMLVIPVAHTHAAGAGLKHIIKHTDNAAVAGTKAVAKKEAFEQAAKQVDNLKTTKAAKNSQAVIPPLSPRTTTVAKETSHIPRAGGAASLGAPLNSTKSAIPPAGSSAKKKMPNFGGDQPVISSQKQAGHIPNTPQKLNRVKQGQPTSTFFGEQSGERLTQQAFNKGKPVPGRPNVREHDFGVSVGTGPNGGMQTKVRVHQDSKGRIHGHPAGQEKY